jgi:hypothetical protein
MPKAESPSDAASSVERRPLCSRTQQEMPIDRKHLKPETGLWYAVSTRGLDNKSQYTATPNPPAPPVRNSSPVMDP